VLVLSNSLGSTQGIWDTHAAAWRAAMRVVRYDHRGHGVSPVPVGPYEIEDLARDLLALLDHLGIERVHFAGISLGGMVGMWLAIHHPERIERLVLCCTAARLPPASAWSRRAEAVRHAGTQAVADTVLQRWLTPQFARDHPDVTENLREMICSTPPEGYASCCDAISGMNLQPLLGRLAAPTLVIAATHDIATPSRHGRHIVQAIQRGRYLEVDAAHLAIVEQAATVTDAVAEHLLGAA